MRHPSWIEIDLVQFKKNIAHIYAHCPSSQICLPVKANAYGHGLVPIAKAASVDYLAVAHLQEGILLREQGIQRPILVLGALHEEQIPDLIHFDLEFSISSRFKADLVSKLCPPGKKCPIHLEVDTGMQRTGVRPATALSLYAYLEKHPCFEVKGVYSHLATADQPEDPFVHHQIKTFKELLGQLHIPKNTLSHLANTGGTTFYPQSHLDMVRPSLLAYGYPPLGAPSSLKDIKPCFALKSKVSYFKVVPKNQGISYGHTYHTQTQTRIVTIPVGYGDGYRRALSNQGSVLIRGKRYPIRGQICMDQLMAEVGQDEVYVGDEVVLIGSQNNQEITLSEVASLCHTIPYEILCLFNERIPRIYLS